MKAEQAIYTSVLGKSAQGYQLASSSRGIHPEWAKLLTLWGPSHGALIGQEPAAESLNCNPIDDQHFAISRTVYGGPEYSRRGELQLFTRFLVFDRGILAGYDDNPWWLLRSCLILGLLRFDSAFDCELPTVQVAESSILGISPTRERLGADSLAEIVQVLQLGHSAAMIGNVNGTLHMPRIMERLSPNIRRHLSFTTGLRPSSQRPFQLHFLPRPTGKAVGQINRLGISQIEVS